MGQRLIFSLQACLRLLWSAWSEPAGLPALGFVCKAVAAGLLALWLAMRFGLAEPSIALLTVFLVISPQSGLVLAKSFYRALGTIVGALAVLLLYALAPQERVLFLLGLLLWLGLCVMEAQRNRNFSAYAYVLAGYTACLIGLPAVNQPDQVFTRAVSRVSEVMLGVLSAGLVSDGLFPSSLRSIMYRELDAQFNRMLEFCRHALQGPATAERMDAAFRGFVADAVSLESRRSSAIFESPELRVRNALLLRLNSCFMEAATALQRLHRWMAHLHREQAGLAADHPRQAELGQALQQIWGHYRQWAATMPERAIAADVPAQLALLRDFAVLQAQLSQQLQHERQLRRSRGLPLALDYEIGADLLDQALLKLWRYIETQVQLQGAMVPSALQAPVQADQDSLRRRFHYHRDHLMGLAAGLRTMLVVAVVLWLWIATEWDSGTTAVIYAAMLSGLFAISAQPGAALQQIWRGFLLACPVAWLCYTVLLPELDSFAMLAVVLAPALGLGAWLLTSAKHPALGAGYNIMLISSLALTTTMHYDMGRFANDILAHLVSVAMASLGFAIVLPLSSRWQQRRMVLGLRRYAVRACLAPLEGLAAAFESGSRDQVQALLAYPAMSAQASRMALDWAQTVHGLGRCALDLRLELRAGWRPYPAPLLTQIQDAIDALAGWFERPGDASRTAAEQLLQQAEHEWLAYYPRAEDASSIRIRGMLHVLHVMLADRGAALDQEPNA